MSKPYQDWNWSSDSRLDPFVGNLDLPGTSYLAELAAQVRAAQEAEDGGRVFILYDAQSPEAAVNSYRRAHARRAREMLGRGWLSEVCVQERRLQLKAYGWQTSHVGAPHNEWVDAEVERQAQGWNEHARGLHATYDDATTVRFPRAHPWLMHGCASPYRSNSNPDPAKAEGRAACGSTEAAATMCDSQYAHW